MRQRDKQAPQSAEETVRDILRATRRHFSAEEKIRIVLDGLRGEDSIAEPSTCGAGSTSTQQHELQPDEPNTLLGQTLNCPEKPDDGQRATAGS
jgi:hypothetical protein